MLHLTRRSFFRVLAPAAGLSIVLPRANAETSAATMADVSAEIEVGDFVTAAKRLELGVAEFPLDRDRRTDLAILQFAAQMFDAAEANLGKVVKLERSFASQPHKLDIEYKEAWYYLAQLRRGHKAAPRAPKAKASLLSVLSGTISAQDFARAAEKERVEFLKGLEHAYTTVTPNGATVRVETDVELGPSLEPAFYCVASFALGEASLGGEAVGEAKTLFQKAVDARATNQIEHHIAKAELARMA